MTEARHRGETRRLRVAHVTLGLEVGGQEKLLVEFARHADRQRFELRVVTLGERGPLAEEVEACGWPVTALGVSTGLRPGLVLRLARLFRRWGTDAVHSHDDRPLIYAAPAARLARVPRVVHTRHGQSFWMTRRQRLLVNATAALTDRFVSVSEDARRLTLRHGVAAKRLGVIWNGIDTERFAFSGPRVGGPAVTVARLSPEKDVATLLRAAARIVAERPHFRLEIAGDGPCMPALRQLVGELGLDGHARLLGRVRDVPALLARASLFVLPSLSEGISLTILEAMARGLPVVATRVGGNCEVVADGETGVLVPAGEPAALAEAILRVLRDPEAGRRIGRAGRQRVERYFDVRRMVAEYEALYAGQTATPAMPEPRPACGRPETEKLAKV
jgi:glycosyltransferase involved in cell wall biosynthesis